MSRLPRMTGPDGLHVHVVSTRDTAAGCWARRFEVYEDAALIVTRSGEILRVYPDATVLAVDFDLAELHEV
jgi:hypothetical protein